MSERRPLLHYPNERSECDHATSSNREWDEPDSLSLATHVETSLVRLESRRERRCTTAGIIIGSQESCLLFMTFCLMAVRVLIVSFP